MDESREEIEETREDASGEISVSQTNDQLEERDTTNDGKRDGNVIVNIESLLTSLNGNLMCKECQLDDMRDFANYQEQEEHKLNSEAEKIPLRSLKSKREWLNSRKKSPSALLEEYRLGQKNSCKKTVETVNVYTVFAASTLKCTCSKGHCWTVPPKKVNPANTKRRKEHKKSRKKINKFEINLQLIGAVQCCGGGATQARTIVSHLGLPCPDSFRNQFRELEDVIGQEQIQVQSELENIALAEEICLTLEKEGEECIDKRSGLVKITISYDMGWSKRSSGRRYDSQSGHAHIVGLYTKKIIGTYTYNKICRKCKLAKIQGKDAEPHLCAQNYASDKSSKSMESDAILQICIEAPERQYLVGTIISDDDTNMRAALKHANGNNKGRLPVSNYCFCISYLY